MSVEDIGTLRQLIARLRKKIEIDPALPRVIITHRSQGYSFAGKEGARWFPEEELALPSAPSSGQFIMVAKSNKEC